MHVGLLTDCYTPVLNGVTHFVRDLKAYLESLGHVAPVFTAGHLDLDDSEPDVLRSSGIALGKTGYYAALRYSRRVQAHLAMMQVLHVHHPVFAGQLALRYAKRCSQPVVYTNHTRLDLYCANFVPPRFLGFAVRLLCRYMRRFTALCDLVIAPSAGLARVMRTEWGVESHVVVVPNGIDVELFTTPRTAIDRAEFGLPTDQPIAIFSGRLSAEKNLAFLIRAFSSAVPESGMGHLLLVGDGPQSASLRALVSRLGVAERVTFAGAVPHERVPSCLAAADFFVSASVTEGHPLSVLEALATGLPVVGIISPGVADTITDGVDGLLTAAGFQDFVRALRRLFVEPDLRSRLARGALATGASKSIENTTNRMLELYKLVLDDRKEPKVHHG